MTKPIIPDTPIEGDTRDRLLEAGLRLFAMYGFDSVSTRQLAQTAGVNIAAIAYHFGGKQELYNAVAEQMVFDTETEMRPLTERVHEAIAAAGEFRSRLSQVAAMVVRGMLGVFTKDERMQLRAALVMREYSFPSSAYDIMFKGRIEPLHKAITALTAAALDRDPEASETIVRAHTVVGQIVVFFITRVILFSRTGWTDIGPEEFEIIYREATASVIASLGLPPLPEEKP